MIKAVLFDMDGVLFDTENMGLAVYRELGEKYGYTMRPGFYETTVGLTGEAARAVYLKEHGVDFAYDPFCRDFFGTIIERARTVGMPEKAGAYECLKALKARGLLLSLATSNARHVVDDYFCNSRLRGMFDAITCGEDVSRSKPAPDIYIEAARKVGVPASECVGVEDSYNGVKSLRAAGAICVMVPDILPYVPELQTQVDHVLSCLDELPTLLDRL